MKVAIHSGKFHSDEAFAIATLKMLGDVDYVRTRDESVMKTCDMRIDVGRKYDSSTGDFDHHQPEGAGKRQNGIPYAAFGLIWKHFGEKVCESRKVADMVDSQLVQVLDAIDSGFDLFEPKIEGVYPFGIDRVFENMMPSWKSNPSPHDIDEAFKPAIELASQILKRAIYKTRDQISADDYVRNAIKDAVDERLIILDQYAPWEEIVIKEAPKALFVALPAWPSPNDDWVLKAIGVDLGSFENRKKLPASWAGKIESELAEVTGVEDAKFCHTKCFMAIAKSKKGCLALAELALDE
ncbi:MAG TPA: MYG1 family protein [Candidatus Saccharimonadales bacterium]|nr:MYG1 family protein [Candidatus Saccharimonadales bacterium]